jgi:hypothetical protein
MNEKLTTRNKERETAQQRTKAQECDATKVEQ